MTQLLRFFITHSGKDMEFAKRLAGDLRAAGLEGFFDARSIMPGEDFVARINKGLDECDVFIPVLSAAALKSSWCTEEINVAINLSHQPSREGRPRIIPALVEDCAAALPPLLQHRLHISFAPAYLSALWELLTRGFGLDPASCVHRANMFSGPRLQTGQEQGDDVFWGAYQVLELPDTDAGKTLRVRVESKGNELSIELWRGGYDGVNVSAWVRDRVDVARSPRRRDPHLEWRIETGIYTVYFMDHVRLKHHIGDVARGFWAYEMFPVRDYEILYRIEVLQPAS